MIETTKDGDMYLECDGCGQVIKIGEEVYEYNDMDLCENCIAHNVRIDGEVSGKTVGEIERDIRRVINTMGRRWEG